MLCSAKWLPLWSEYLDIQVKMLATMSAAAAGKQLWHVKRLVCGPAVGLLAWLAGTSTLRDHGTITLGQRSYCIIWIETGLFSDAYQSYLLTPAQCLAWLGAQTQEPFAVMSVCAGTMVLSTQQRTDKCIIVDGVSLYSVTLSTCVDFHTE